MSVEIEHSSVDAVELKVHFDDLMYTCDGYLRKTIHQQKEIDDLRSELDKILNSRSWRLMAYPRALFSKIRKLLG